MRCDAPLGACLENATPGQARIASELPPEVKVKRELGNGVRFLPPAPREPRLLRSGHLNVVRSTLYGSVVNLILRCPFCGHQHPDDWEILGPGGPEFFRCENAACMMSFAFLIHECSSCVRDSVFTWKEMPSRPAVAALVCQHCAEPISEAAGETQGANPP